MVLALLTVPLDNNGRRVVIKTPNDSVQRRSDFTKFQQDFLNEAIKLAKCNHPHVVRIDEVIQEENLWCMVMEYIDGGDLGIKVESQGVLSEVEALRDYRRQEQLFKTQLLAGIGTHALNLIQKL